MLTTSFTYRCALSAYLHQIDSFDIKSGWLCHHLASHWAQKVLKHRSDRELVARVRAKYCLPSASNICTSCVQPSNLSQHTQTQQFQRSNRVFMMCLFAIQWHLQVVDSWMWFIPHWSSFKQTTSPALTDSICHEHVQQHHGCNQQGGSIILMLFTNWGKAGDSLQSYRSKHPESRNPLAFNYLFRFHQ